VDSPASPESRTLGLLGLLLELVLPAALSATLLLLLAGSLPAWDLHSPLGLGAFGLLLVVLSLFVSLRLDGFTRARRRERGKNQLLNRASPRWRIFKFILGGALIPVAAFVAANLVELPNHKTPMAMAIHLRLGRSEGTRAEQLGSAVLRSERPAVKVQGILALQALNSPEALDQLLRILNEDTGAMKDGPQYQALCKALASHGAQAKPRLLQLFAQTRASSRRTADAPPGDIFDRYFAASFVGLASELDSRDLGEKTRTLEELEAAKTELKKTLSRLATETPSPQGGDPLPSFIMQAFLQMSLKEDAELLAFARQTAADSSWSDPVRGQALLLTAKLGGKDDLDGLYAHLGSPSALLEARALQAIATLQSRLLSTSPSP